MITVTAMESTLEEFLPQSSDDLEVGGILVDQDSEGMNMHTFLNMPEDEFANALEKAMDRKGKFMQVSGIFSPQFCNYVLSSRNSANEKGHPPWLQLLKCHH